MRRATSARWLWVAATVAASLAVLAGPASAVDLCSAEGRGYMRQAGIAEELIQKACDLARRNSVLLGLSVKRTENQSGYCRVTLALHNNSLLYLNQMTLTTLEGRFEIFRFSDILPGDVGYAAATSRLLLDCSELATVHVEFHWPISLRIGDRTLMGIQLQDYRPALLNDELRWSP